MDWDDARFLLALRRTRDLSEAGRALGVSHTTVSRRLARLERDLGLRLLDRRTEGPRLTVEALELADLAEPMEKAADAMARRLSGADRGLAGLVRVTSTEALGARILAPALAELAARHPGLTVELAPDPRTFSLARREADVAVRLVRPREQSSVGRRVGRVAYAVYASPRYLSGPRKPERLVTYGAPVASGETEWLLRRFSGAQVALRSPSTLALATAAAAGSGVALLPCFVGDAEPGLVRLAPPGEVEPSAVWLVVHRDLKRSARASAVAEHIAAAVRRAGPVLEGSSVSAGIRST